MTRTANVSSARYTPEQLKAQKFNQEALRHLLFGGEIPAPTKKETKFDLSMMSRGEKYELASRIISEISNEWTDADNTEQWQEEHLLEYESSMSFDELAAEVRAVSFR